MLGNNTDMDAILQQLEKLQLDWQKHAMYK